MRLSILEGAPGCARAVERAGAAVIVDALRASATATMLLHHQARMLLVVREVEDAFKARDLFPGALLFGERGGLPPDGFDFGNSPRDAAHARGRDVVFTTTTGATRLIDAWGASMVLMATTMNAAAAARHLVEARVDDVTLIPAGLATDPGFYAQEDWVAATCIAKRLIDRLGANNPPTWEEGEEAYHAYSQYMDRRGIQAMFMTAPHADKLRAVGMAPDIHVCARVDVCDTLPLGVQRHPMGVVLRAAAD